MRCSASRPYQPRTGTYWTTEAVCGQAVLVVRAIKHESRESEAGQIGRRQDGTADRRGPDQPQQ